jgi:hypothetical protein
VGRRTNYGFEKRQRELKKQKKREAKLERKRQKKDEFGNVIEAADGGELEGNEDGLEEAEVVEEAAEEEEEVQ